MESLNKLEVMVASWYKGVPHLPPQAQKWLGENMWWLTLIGVVLGAMGLLTMLMGGLALVGLAGAAVFLAGFALIGIFVAVLVSAVSLVVAGIAISPLKAHSKKGWSLLFLTVLIQVASVVVSFLFSFNIFGLISGLLWAAVGAYFLFEIRSFYGSTATAKKVETDKKA